MKPLRAEVISIGDEITSGVRLDTNTQWISARLGDLGIQVAFHSTVGDDIEDNVEVFRQASRRVDIIIATGGLGPTADDLTRQAIADMAGVNLVENQSVLDHIVQMFQSRGRTMPPNNQIQAMFPFGSKVIDNPEGSAPGIDFSSKSDSGSDYRILALPGVPVEMKQMWEQTVESELRRAVGNDFVIHHHTIHCFGSGESQIESLLPDLIRRGRDPQVGITASAATISLRVTTRSESTSECVEKMQPTIKTIHDSLGDLVFGENGTQLEQVVVRLLKARNQTLAIQDVGLGGAVSSLIANEDSDRTTLIKGEIVNASNMEIRESASALALQTGADFGLVIGPVNRETTSVDSGNSFYEVVIVDQQGAQSNEFRFSGHSGWREIRAVKEVLNFLRLHLLNSVN